MDTLDDANAAWDDGYDCGHAVGRREAFCELLTLLAPSERGGVIDAIKRKLNDCNSEEMVAAFRAIRSNESYQKDYL